jgi:hypothetical protein
VTPVERLVVRTIHTVREQDPHAAIMPIVLARTGVCEATYWRCLHIANRETLTAVA